jgi:hypothetical protein
VIQLLHDVSMESKFRVTPSVAEYGFGTLAHIAVMNEFGELVQPIVDNVINGAAFAQDELVAMTRAGRGVPVARIREYLQALHGQKSQPRPRSALSAASTVAMVALWLTERSFAAFVGPCVAKGVNAKMLLEMGHRALREVVPAARGQRLLVCCSTPRTMQVAGSWT